MNTIGVLWQQENTYVRTPYIAHILKYIRHNEYQMNINLSHKS